MIVAAEVPAIIPRIVRSYTPTILHIRTDGVLADIPSDELIIQIYPVSGLQTQTNWQPPFEAHPAVSETGLSVTYPFSREGEYTLLAHRAPVEPRSKPLLEARLYALDDDLFERRPYKGDLHMHSNRSDGKEPPAYVAGAARRIGLDFMAVTDHWRYQPSLEAIQAFEGLPVDLRIYPGEEVHFPVLPLQEGVRHSAVPVHIINFGGQFSVNELIAARPDDYQREVKTIAEAVAPELGACDPIPYASCHWCFDQIRRAKGLGIFCHPYWYTRHRYDVPERLTDQLFEWQPFDAVEFLGGYHLHEVESNYLQAARVAEEQAKGKRIPIVAVSDAHGCDNGELFGWYTTLVFARTPELPDLIQSIKDLWSVAVEALPGTTPRAHGPFRLVKYAQYLLREILPLHDTLCRQEGLAMLDYIAGREDALSRLAAMQGQVRELYASLWGQGG